MAYGVLLIILIPLFITYNTTFIVTKYNDSIDTLVQREGLSIGRAIYALIKEDLSSTERLQTKIESLIAGNRQILEVNILEPVQSEFRVTASSDRENLGSVYTYEYYTLAWAQPDNDGLATDFFRFAEHENVETGITEEDERFWLVAMPMTDSSGHKSALLTIKLSSEIIDTLTTENRNQSVYLLIITVVVVILFLMIAVRLWDYALLYRKIKEVDQMKDEFISMASHELRTPVTAIRGYISMILDGSYGAVNEDIKKSLGNVEVSTKRLGALVEDLLEVGKIEQGKISITNKHTDVRPLMEKVIEDLTAPAKSKGLLLVFTPHKEKLPELTVDADRFTQVLINLIGNAIKYTARGQVDILTSEKSGGRYLEIKVKDTGIGMSSNDRKNLFSKFYRIRNDKTKDIGGTGLGLWITKELVELMNGEIDVDSIEDVGTQFTITFPVHKA